jgi:hypothetical protein
MQLHNYIDKTSEQLEAMTTPQLMMLRKLCFSSFRDCGDPCHCPPNDSEDITFNAKLTALQSKVCAILPHREHVPDKVEAKKIRQARAKQSR